MDSRPARPGGSEWRTRLGQDFDVRSYVFDSHLRAVDGFETLAFDGTGSALGTSLAALVEAVPRPAAGRRPAVHRRQPDRRRATSTGRRCRRSIPWFPPRGAWSATWACANVSVSQTNFESAPVVLRADVDGRRLPGRADRRGRRRRDGQRGRAPGGQARAGDGKPLGFRFQFRPERQGRQLLHRPRVRRPREEAKPDRRRGPPRRVHRADARQQQPARGRRSGGRPLPGALRRAAGRTGSSSSSAARSTTTSRSSSSACCGSPAASRSSTSRARGQPGSTSPLYDGFDNPDAETAERPTRRCWSGSARATRSSCATASRRPPRSCTATTRSSSTTSRPASSRPTSSRSCGTS